VTGGILLAAGFVFWGLCVPAGRLVLLVLRELALRALDGQSGNFVAALRWVASIRVSDAVAAPLGAALGPRLWQAAAKLTRRRGPCRREPHKPE
jgi:hypothetical protein